MPIHTNFLDPNIRGASVAPASHVRTSTVSAYGHQKSVRLQHTALRNTVKSSVVLVASNVETCPLLRKYTAYSGNSLPTSGEPTGPIVTGLIGCPEIPVNNYHHMQHNFAVEQRSPLLCGGSLKSSNVARSSNFNGRHRNMLCSKLLKTIKIP
jgi:hypothetical protein